MIDFINLTNGIQCLPLPLGAKEPHFIRLQSTWCEQKRWGPILTSVGADLLYHLSAGYSCCVHDRSECPRQTRAIWQGLVWIQFACRMAWGGKPSWAYVQRGKRVHNAQAYFLQQWNALEHSERQAVRYFRKFGGSSSATLGGCDCV